MNKQMKLLMGFAVIYVVWGSTFFAIKVGIESIPPFMLMGLRFLIAGALLLGVSVSREGWLIPRHEWPRHLGQAMLMVVLGTGIVGWAEERVDSGVAALVLAATPVWLVLMEAFRPGGARPGRNGILGLLIGMGGMLVLIGPSPGSGGIDPLGSLILLVASVSWALGSILGRHQEAPRSPLQVSGLQMVLGGLILLAMGAASGETLQLASITGSSLAALVYLVTMGSLLVYPTYLWLMRNAAPALVATHAYVNPIVALAIGYFLGGEPMTAKTLFASLLILASVGLITGDNGKHRRRRNRFGWPRRRLRSV